MPTVPSAANPFAQALRYLLADSQLVALLPGGIYPDLSQPPANQLPTPGRAQWALVRDLGETLVGGLNRLAFVVELHDLPANGRATLIAAAERIEALVDGALWQACTASIRNPYKSHWQSRSNPIAAPAYGTHMVLCQFYLTSQ